MLEIYEPVVSEFTEESIRNFMTNVFIFCYWHAHIKNITDL